MKKEERGLKLKANILFSAVSSREEKAFINHLIMIFFHQKLKTKSRTKINTVCKSFSKSFQPVYMCSSLFVFQFSVRKDGGEG